MKYFPDPKFQVPPVELLPLPSGKNRAVQGVSSAQAAAEGKIAQPSARNRRSTETVSIDIRQPIVHEFLESGNLEPNSRRAYDRALKRFLSWSKVAFSEVSPRQVTQYRDWLEHTPSERTGRPLARSSVNLEVAALKVFFRWLHERYPHHCSVNPTVQVKQRKVHTPAPDDISSVALEYIWTTLPLLGEMAIRDTMLVHLLCHGLRASEIVGLNLASFDGEVLFLTETKNHSSRIVPLSQSSIQVLHQYLQWRRELALPLEPELPLLISLHVAHVGERLSYRGIYQAVERIGRKARERFVLDWLVQMEQDEESIPALRWSAAQAVRLGSEVGKWDEESLKELLPLMPHAVRQVVEELAAIHPHNFRHTYATQLLLKGLDPAHARKLTGHQSQQVFQRYTQRAEQQAAIDAFRRLEQAGGSIVPG